MRLQPSGANVNDDILRQLIKILAKGATHIDLFHQLPRTQTEQAVAAMDGIGTDPAQIHRHPRSRLQHLVGRIFAVQTAHFHRASAVRAGQLQGIPYPQRARRQRARDHGASAFHGKRAVDPHTHPSLRIRGRHLGQYLIQHLPHLRDALTGMGGNLNQGCVGKRGTRQLMAHLGGDLGATGGIGAISTSQGDQPMPDVQRTHGIAVIRRLLLPTFISSDHENDHRRRAHTGEHIAQELLVPRHVDKRQVRP